MPVLLGLLSAAVWGGADFLGGLASKRSPSPSVVLLSGSTGLVGAVALLALLRDPVSIHDLALGAIAGVVGTTGVSLLYAGLAAGRMGVVAPLSALVAAVIPIGWGLARGERPSALAAAGVAVAVGAVLLVTREPVESTDILPGARRGAAMGALSGIGFGVVFICFAEVSARGGMWSLVSGRAVGTVLLVAVLSAARRPRLPQAPDRATAAGAGVLDLTANAFFILAARRGLTSVVAPVASLYPAGCVILARLVLQERLQRQQLAGMLLALAGLVLIGAG